LKELALSAMRGDAYSVAKEVRVLAVRKEGKRMKLEGSELPGLPGLQ